MTTTSIQEPAQSKGWSLQGRNPWKTLVKESLPRNDSFKEPNVLQDAPISQELWPKEGKILHIQQKVITRWKYAVEKSKKQAQSLSVEFRRRHLLGAFLRLWIQEQKQLSNREWKEDIRAKVVGRYKTLDRFWKTWKNKKFSLDIQRIQMRRATLSDIQRQQRRGIESWIKYRDHRRQKERVNHRALSFRLRNLVKKSLKKWKLNASFRLKHRGLEMNASDQARKARLLYSFYHWKGRHDVSEYWKEQERIGHGNYKDTLQAKCLVHWNYKLKLKETLNWNEENAKVFFNRNRVAQSLHIWKVIHLHRQVTANQTELAVWTYRRRVLTLITRLWRKKTLDALKNDLLEDNVAKYRQVLIKKRFIERLYSMKEDNKFSESFYSCRIVKNVFRRWMQLAEFRTFFRDQKESHKGVAFYYAKLKLNILSRWKEYLMLAREKNARLRLARVFRIRRKYLTCFRKMKILHKQRRNMAELNVKADQQLRYRVFLRTLSTWMRHCHNRMEDTHNTEKARIQYKRALCLNVIRCLRDNVFYAREQWYNMECAQVKHNRTLTQNAVNHWIVYTNRQLKKSDMKRRAIRQWYRLRIWFTWDTWQHRLVSLNQERVRHTLMDMRYDQITLKNHFLAWKDYIQAKSSLVRAIENLELRRVNRTILRHFQIWRSRYLIRIRNACNVWHIRKVIDDNRSRSAIEKWRQVLKARRVEQEAEDEWVRTIRTELDSLKTFRALEALVTYYDHRLAKRRLCECALSFFKSRLQKRIIQTWIIVFRHRRWVKVVHSIAQNMLHKRLLFPAFQRWIKIRQDWKIIYRKSHIEPCVRYQKSILSKILQAWKRFTIESKDFESLIEKAKQNRIDRLIKHGLISWISIVDEMEKLKIEHARRWLPGIKPHALLAAHKYGTIWLKKARSSLVATPRYQHRERHNMQLDTIPLNGNITTLPNSLKQSPIRTRRAPRKPTFLMDSDSKYTSRTAIDKLECGIPLMTTSYSVQSLSKSANAQISNNDVLVQFSAESVGTEIDVQTGSKDKNEVKDEQLSFQKCDQVDDSRKPIKSEISIQTDPEPLTLTKPLNKKEIEETLDRHDSGIEVEIEENRAAVIEKSGSVLTLEKIISSIPKDHPEPVPHDPTPKTSLTIQEIESRLLKFHALKVGYLENKSRIGQLQREIHDMIFFGHTDTDLDAKTRELDAIMQQVKNYEESLESRNQEIILLSMQIEFFLKNQESTLI